MSGTRSELTKCWAVHYCDGCDAKIEPGELHYDHMRVQPCPTCQAALDSGGRAGYHGHVVEVLSECLDCAVRNGRPEVADPATAEQPLDLGGIA